MTVPTANMSRASYRFSSDLWYSVEDMAANTRAALNKYMRLPAATAAASTRNKFVQIWGSPVCLPPSLPISSTLYKNGGVALVNNLAISNVGSG